MMSTLFVLFIGVWLVLSPRQLQAQDDNYQQRYELFRQQAQDKFTDFRTKCNAEYVKFMQQAWEAYNAMPAIPKPKDKRVPPIIFSEDYNGKVENEPVVINNVVEPITPLPQPVPLSPIYEGKGQENNTITFMFFGTECKIRVPQNKTFGLYEKSEKALAIAWQELSSSKYNNTIRDFLDLRFRYKLCDWAYLCMINTFAKLYAEIEDEATLLTAFIYSQSGYQMRLAMDGDRLVLLYGSIYNIYERPYFKIDSEIYIPFTEDSVKRISVCNYAFPNAKPLSLELRQIPAFTYIATKKRSLSSKRYPNLNVEVTVNKNLIDFYNSYPTGYCDENFMTRWAIYANTPFEQNVIDSFERTLKDCINSLNELESAEIILNWVQTAFPYGYDDKVWGYDRAFFAEETLFYPYSDCEDRAILFTCLIRDLLGLDCILVYYPGHLATAVCFTMPVVGDSIKVKDLNFIICDPTYIGAPVGHTMPNMDNSKAKIILLKSFRN